MESLLHVYIWSFSKNRQTGEFSFLPLCLSPFFFPPSHLSLDLSLFFHFVPCLLSSFPWTLPCFVCTSCTRLSFLVCLPHICSAPFMWSFVFILLGKLTLFWPFACFMLFTYPFTLSPNSLPPSLPPPTPKMEIGGRVIGQNRFGFEILTWV